VAISPAVAVTGMEVTPSGGLRNYFANAGSVIKVWAMGMRIPRGMTPFRNTEDCPRWFLYGFIAILLASALQNASSLKVTARRLSRLSP
jgi:hypothetical protein